MHIELKKFHKLIFYCHSGVIGGVALLILAALAGFFFTRKKRRGIVDLTEENKGPEMDLEPYHIPPGGPQPFQPGKSPFH
jgi:hypothetical protein